MFKCTYIILIQNDAYNIKKLIDSLKKINGNFKKEYIFIDDGSEDESLKKLKEHAAELPRATIITQNAEGGAACVNKAANIAHGDYLHFVRGHEILCKDSTANLIEAALEFDAEIALGNINFGAEKKEILTGKNMLIEDPIKDFLSNKNSICKNIGDSGSLISRKLFLKIGAADESVYMQNYSLALKCAHMSKIVYVQNAVTKIKNKEFSLDEKFIYYNLLKSIYLFGKKHTGLMSNYQSELLQCLTDHSDISNSSKLKHIFLKYTNSLSMQKIMALYEKELEKLF